MTDQCVDIPPLLAQARKAVNEGRFEDARRLCETVFTRDPGNLGALQAYCSATRFAKGDPVFARLERFAQTTGLPDAVMSQLHFMRGKALDDMGRHEKAFEAFVLANRLKPVSFDAQAKSDFADTLIEAVQKAPSMALPPAPPRMIFILGMPRSGSTLLAQMLGAHPKITNLGEVEAMAPALTTLDGRRVRLTGFLAGLRASTLEDARRRYLKDIDPAALASGNVLVDKMPENYWLAWAIPMLFPDAVIVHMRREKLAVCWSCFRNDFGKGHEYSCDFGNLLRQFETQERLSSAWKARDPGHWTDVRLETLSEAPRQTLEPLLARLDLAWDDACLKPERVGTAVKTLSKWQVRRGIDPDIAGGWTAYRPMIRRTWGI